MNNDFELDIIEDLNNVFRYVVKDYSFLEREDLEIIKTNSLNEFNNLDNKSTNAYIELLKELLNKKTIELISMIESKEKTINSIIFSKLKQYGEIESLDDLIKYFSSIGYSPNVSDYKIILENEKVKTIIRRFIRENKIIIKNSGISEYKLLDSTKKLIELFCVRNDIPIEDKKTISDEGKNSSSSIRNTIPKFDVLTKEEERELFAQYRAGSEVAKDKLIKHNLGLVKYVASGYTCTGIPFDDLFQTGVIGLIKALDEFDLERDNKFSTCASWWIASSIRTYIRRNSTVFKTPVHVVEMKAIIRRANDKLSKELGREPTYQELSDETGIELKKVVEVLFVTQPMASLDDSISGDEDNYLYLYIPVIDESLEENIFDKQRSEFLNDVLESVLTPREKDVIMSRFGFKSDTIKTLEETGEKYNVTRERIRQIEGKALRKLKRSKYSKELKSFLDN